FPVPVWGRWRLRPRSREASYAWLAPMGAIALVIGGGVLAVQSPRVALCLVVASVVAAMTRVFPLQTLAAVLLLHATFVSSYWIPIVVLVAWALPTSPLTQAQAAVFGPNPLYLPFPHWSYVDEPSRQVRGILRILSVLAVFLLAIRAGTTDRARITILVAAAV